MSSGPSDRVRIPADVERPDALLAGLAPRQLAVLAVGAVALWAGYLATRAILPLPALGALSFPLAAAVALVALGRRDGLSADRLVAAAWAHVRSPRQLALAPEGAVPSPPAWAGSPQVRPAPLRLPLRAIGQDGVIDLGADGAALICRASSVTFALRTSAEQGAMVAGFGRFLNSLAEPVQVLVRAEAVELGPAVAALEDAAGGLPHPGLEAAARDHARFLSELAARRDLLRREVLVVLRQPAFAAGPSQDAPARLRRQAGEAAAALAGAGVSLSVLEGDEAAACLARCLDPTGPPRPAGMSRPGAAVTAGANP
jgi:hypothetical protein